MNLQAQSALRYLTEAHITKLQKHYGINPEAPAIKDLIAQGLLRSLTPEEARRLTGREDLDSGGILLCYPGTSEVYTIRLDNPPASPSGKQQKYLRPAGQGNRLFIPPGVDLEGQELWITEGELKALTASLRGLPVAALAGIWCWRTQPEDAELYGEEKVPDSEALIPDLRRDWAGKRLALIYDSDIDQHHAGYPAFQRLAEQLYRQGAREVKILTLPSLVQDGKTGLDDFILARERAGKDPVSELRRLVARAPVYLPTGDGAETYADMLISENPDDPDTQVRAATAILAAKGEVYCRGWLKRYIKTKELQAAILKEAKSKAPVRVAPKPATPPPKKILDNPAYAPVLPLLAGTRYRVDMFGGLCYVKYTPDGGEEDIPLANFVPYPVREIVCDNGVEREAVFEIAGVLAGGIPLPAVKIPAERFAGMGWVAANWGMNANLEPGQNVKDRVRHAIQSLAKNIPREVVYTHLGWRKINDKWVFLHAGGAVGGEGVQIETDNRLARYRLPAEEEEGSIEEAVTASLDLLDVAPLKVTLPLLSITYLAPLCEPLRKAGIEPGFLLWLYGVSGAMKSTLAALFLSHFGDFDPKSLPASFRDTAAGLEKRAFAAKDVLIVIDDFHPASDTNEARKIEQVAQQLIRAFGDRVGRGRMRSNTSLRPDYPPRGMALATGEQIPGGESSQARLFVIELNRGDVDVSRLSRAQANKDKLPQAMTAYLKWLPPQLDDLPGELKGKFQQLRAAALAEGQHLRVPEAVAWLYLGLATFLDFARSAGAITEARQRELAQEGWQVLTDLAAEQAQRVEAERPALKFVNLLREMFTQKLIYLRGVDGQEPPDAVLFGWEAYEIDGEEKFRPGNNAAFMGWSDGEYLYLLPEAVYKEVARFSQSQGTIFPVKAQTLWKHLEVEGLLITERSKDKDGRERVYRTVRPPKQIKEAPPRLLKLDLQKILRG